MTAACIACAGGDEPATDRGTPDIAHFDTIVGVDTDVLGIMADVSLAPDSTLWILDRGNGRIVTLGTGGGVVGTLAARGRGPGELLRPTALIVDGSAALVLDLGNGRVQFYDRSGAAAGYFEIGRSVPVPAALNARGDIAAPTFGHEGALVVIIEDRARRLRRIGSPVAIRRSG